jgi:hypothetical protein
MSYLKFEDRGTSPSGKTKRWVVLNSISGVALGWVQWHPSFRKYAFESLPSIVYDACCLLALAEFVEEKTKEHKS